MFGPWRLSGERSVNEKKSEKGEDQMEGVHLHLLLIVIRLENQM